MRPFKFYKQDTQYFIYVLECRGEVYYVGMTRQLATRIHNHINKRGAKFTKKYPPYKLVHLEMVENFEDAVKREKELISTAKILEQFKYLTVNFCLPHEFDELFYQIAAMKTTGRHAKAAFLPMVIN